MARFPKIQSPCPYQANRAAMMDGDWCRMCKREVIDLTAMDDAGRVAFFSNCATEVCVSYSVPIRSALGAAALAAAAVAALPAAAQDVPAPAVDAPAPAQIIYGNEQMPAEGDDVIIVMGGIKRPGHVEFAAPEDATVPEMPVVYENPAPAPAKRN